MKTNLSLIVALAILTLPGVAEAQENRDPSPAPAQEGKPFTFAGGSLLALLKEMESHFGVDVLKLATIPEEALYSVRVPKMTVQSPLFHSVLRTYNTLSDQGVQGLGRWAISTPPIPRGEQHQIEAIVFVPPKRDPRHVRAFDLGGFTDERIKQLERIVADSREDVGTSGQLRYHRDARILLAVGDERFGELVAELIEQMRPRLPSARD